MKTKKRTWGALNGGWVPHDTRDAVVDFVGHAGRAETELPATRLVGWLGLGASKYYDWKHRYGKANEHNARVPRDHWLEPWEKQAIVDFHVRYPLEGYRRLTFMMLDRGRRGGEPVAACIACSSEAGLLQAVERNA